MDLRCCPIRWIVERTFAWIGRNRRLACDFERHATAVAAFIESDHAIRSWRGEMQHVVGALKCEQEQLDEVKLLR